MDGKGFDVKSGERAGMYSKLDLRAEDELEIMVEFLRLVNESESTGELLRASAAFFRQKSGCEVLGIRLKQGEDYPYYIARGFSPEFLEKENHLCASSKDGKTLYDREGLPVYECVCGNVVCGRFNPLMPFYTAKGSFWTNSTSELVSVYMENDLMANIRGRCVENFESVAVICIRLGGETLGLLHLNDRRKGMFSLEIIERWERLADQLALALAKFRAEELVQKARNDLEKQVEERTADLKSSEEKFRDIVETADEGIWMLDRESRIIFINSQMVRTLGYSSEEMMDHSSYDYVDGHYIKIAKFVFNKRKRGLKGTMDIKLRKKDGSEIWARISSSPRFKDDVFDGVLEMITDVTNDKKVALKMGWLASFPNSSPDPIIEMDRYGRISYTNPIADILFPDLRTPEPCHPYLDGIDTIFTRLHKTGSAVASREVWIGSDCYEQSFSFHAETDSLRIYGRDITKRKQAEETMRKSETNLAKSQVMAHVGSWEMDVKTGEIDRSAESYRIFGLAPGDTKINYQQFLEFIVPEDVEHVDNIIKSSIKTGQPYNILYHIKRRDGEIRILQSHGEVISYDSGRLIKLYSTNHDITELKQSELELQNAKALLEMYNDLLGHDINNMNQVGIGYLELAIDTLGLSEDGKKLLSKPLESLVNSSKLIENVRTLQHIKLGEVRHEKVDINTILLDVKNAYSSVLDRDIIINYMPMPGSMVVANKLLRDVFSNLVGNAIKHSTGALEINMGISRVSENGIEYFMVYVEDNGPGISDNIKDKLFTRFQRGNTKASGRGLGLYLVKSLVEDFHGSIHVEDRVKGDYSNGARFVVMLPVAEDINV